MLENFNYWRDPRTVASMIEKPRIQETKNGVHILFEVTGEDEVITVHWLKTRYTVCPTCDGHGKHVNASIDCGGLTQEDFDADPGFRDDYFSGMHDVTCVECAGKRVIATVDEHANDPAIVQQYRDDQDERYRDAWESAQERAMGA